jgi:hypothetical protein
MKRSSAPRKAANLPGSIHHKLNMYTLAASAAGVGVLALTQSADAKIVYTKTDVNVFKTYPGFALDLNNDGVADFRFVGAQCHGCTSSVAVSSVIIWTPTDSSGDPEERRPEQRNEYFTAHS